MKMNLKFLVLAMSFFMGATSFANEAAPKTNSSMSVSVLVAKCEKVEIGNPYVVTLSWRAGEEYTVNSSDFSNGNVTKVATSDQGTLTTHMKLLNFPDQQSIKIFVRYSSKDQSEKGNVYLYENFGSSLHSESGVCEKPEDVGNISIKISTQQI
ncbi:MAG: hypothetical protein ACXVCP_15450 [Bdellovibrio sp.]